MTKPIHKHVAHHVRKYHKHLTKYLYERDTIFATVSVFILLILLGLIPINFYVLNPMKLALKDFDFNDIAYAKLEKGKDKIPIDKNITVINTGHLDRAELGFLIEKVNSYNPKVIGLDIYFEAEKEPEKDSILREALRKTKNLVGVSVGVWGEQDFMIKKNYFDDVISKRGYANLIGEEIGTIRYFSPFEEVNHKKYPQIATAIVKEFDHEAYERIEKRHKAQEIINYRRRVDQYQIISAENIMIDMFESRLLKDKIVLFGYINDDPNDVEDKKFTPMNKKFVGKAIPDMNGIIVQANIISMILEGNYIKKIPKWMAWLFAVLIGWIHMSLFIRYYLEDHIWFHLVAKLAQLFSILFFAYLGIFIFDKFDIKLDMKYTLYVIVLAVDIIYFYEAIAVWLHKKFGYRTVFHQHHHGQEHQPADQHQPIEHHHKSN